MHEVTERMNACIHSVISQVTHQHKPKIISIFYYITSLCALCLEITGSSIVKQNDVGVGLLV